MSQAKVKGYDILHQRGTVTISRGEHLLRFTPAEAEQIRSIINIALSMESLPALPPSIQNDKFLVRFNTDDTLFIDALDGRISGLKFDWSEGDDLIKVVDEGQALALNDLKLGVGGVTTKSFIDNTPNIG